MLDCCLTDAPDKQFKEKLKDFVITCKLSLGPQHSLSPLLQQVGYK